MALTPESCLIRFGRIPAILHWKRLRDQDYQNHRRQNLEQGFQIYGKFRNSTQICRKYLLQGVTAKSAAADLYYKAM